jgi:hypothetical protein
MFKVRRRSFMLVQAFLWDFLFLFLFLFQRHLGITTVDTALGKVSLLLLRLLYYYLRMEQHFNDRSRMGTIELNLPQELGHHLSGMDNMFFQLEHPRRLLTICSVWLFNERLDTATVLDSLKNLCGHYPRFCLVPKSTGSCLETPIWSRPQRNWSFKDNIGFHTLDEPTTECLQKYIASQVMITLAQ